MPPPAAPPNQTGFNTAVADTTLSEAMITLRKRRWVVIAAVLLGLAYGIYASIAQPKLYVGPWAHSGAHRIFQ